MYCTSLLEDSFGKRLYSQKHTSGSTPSGELRTYVAMPLHGAEVLNKKKLCRAHYTLIHTRPFRLTPRAYML